MVKGGGFLCMMRHHVYVITSVCVMEYRIVNLAHDVDLSQDTLLHTCARHLKTSGHVSIPHV